MSHPAALNELEPFTKKGGLRVVIETPKGSRNRYGNDRELGAFKLNGVLPEGAFFPCDFGFVPSTQGDDGDPLDVLLLLDEPAFPGCVLTARLIGAIAATQRERGGQWVRNDRLVAVATHAHTHEPIASLEDLRPGMLDEVEGFFAHYNRIRDREFKPEQRCNGARARDEGDAERLRERLSGLRGDASPRSARFEMHHRQLAARALEEVKVAVFFGMRDHAAEPHGFPAGIADRGHWLRTGRRLRQAGHEGRPRGRDRRTFSARSLRQLS